MEIVIMPDAAEAARVAAEAVQSLLRRKPRAVLGLATGSSPLPLYAELIRRTRAGKLSFAACAAFILDEYIGLPADHPQRYREVIRREFTGQVDFVDSDVHGPDGGAADLAAACASFEDAIHGAGGVDLQILGVGTDGHLGFNEPGSSLASRTRIKTLAEQTRADNARFFDSPENVPRHVVTQGLGTILESRHLLLIATGTGKARAVRGLAEGPVTAMCPASVMQLHPHATVLVDEAAAAELALADYYRHAYQNKPGWQGL